MTDRPPPLSGSLLRVAFTGLQCKEILHKLDKIIPSAYKQGGGFVLRPKKSSSGNKSLGFSSFVLGCFSSSSGFPRTIFLRPGVFVLRPQDDFSSSSEFRPPGVFRACVFVLPPTTIFPRPWDVVLRDNSVLAFSSFVLRTKFLRPGGRRTEPPPPCYKPLQNEGKHKEQACRRQ